MLDDMLHRTKIEDPKELFVHELGAALTMENTVAELLGVLLDKADDPRLKHQLRHHLEETQGQIRNLEQAFSTIGLEPREQPCPAIDGIAKDGESTLGMAEPSLYDVIILAACGATEHHEIAVYESLVAQAGASGHEDIAALLQENLEQEQHTLAEVRKAGARAGRVGEARPA